MPRYIDADKAIQQIRKQSSRSVARECAVNAVNNTPAEDVAPVIHAHWIETEDLSGDHYAECSNCCLLWWIDGESSQEAEMNYCPRCGAKMDEEIEDAKIYKHR